jgi:hypothetical protein
MHPGSNRDGWWMNQDIIKQVVDKAIPIFERTHPGKVALFMFDNSCNHNAYADNALVVSQMNLKNGGKQCDACKSHAFDPMKPQCCTTGILGHQPDFASQKNHLQETIEAAGHVCIFYPKFHCELNFIESFWREAKWYLRLHCDYSFKSLKEIVLQALESVTLAKIHHYARRSARYMSAYEQGLLGKAAVFAIKKYRSHRRVPECVLEEFGHMK